MAPSLTANRVFETSLSVGPGPYVLIGAVPGGYATFAEAVAQGLQQPFFCTAVETATGLWKTGFATANDNLLSFTQVLGNNYGTTANVAFTGTLVNIFMTIPANCDVYTDQNGILNVANFVIAATLAGLLALTKYPVGTLAAVTSDSNAAANNGIYYYTGSTWLATPAASQDYVNNAVANGRVAPLAEMDCASTASLTLSGEQTINGFHTSGSRVAALGNGAASGPYLTSSGAWARTTDANTAAKIGLASFLVGPNDQVNGGKTFQCQQLAANITLGTTLLTFAIIGDPTFLQNQITALQNFPVMHYIFHPTGATTIFPAYIGASAYLLGWDVANQYAVGLGINTLIKAQLAPFNKLLRGMYLFNGATQTQWTPWMGPDGTPYVNPFDLGGGGSGGRVTPPIPLPTADIPTVNTYYQLCGSSQSLETGSRAQPVLPTQPTYGHLTFGSGPRSSKPGSVGNNSSPGTTTAVALFENTLSANVDTSNGETASSGWANGFTQFAAEQNGIAPGTQLFICSAAGLNGATIEQVSPGDPSNWWQLFVDQNTEAKARIVALSGSNTISVPACDFPQGASDLTDTVSQIMTLFLNYQAAVQAQVLANTGQTYPVKLLLTVLSSDVTGTTGAMQQAQYLLCQQYPQLFTFVTTGKTLQYATDNRHYSAIGQLIRGNYLARVTKQLVIDHIYPPALTAISATVNSNGFFSLKCIVPIFPMVLVGHTFQSGIRIIDQTGDLTLTDISADGDSFTAVFSRPTNGAWTCRVGIDYLDPDGPPIVLGATCDIQDSCTDSFISDGITYTLPHVIQPCILTGITLGSQ